MDERLFHSLHVALRKIKADPDHYSGCIDILRTLKQAIVQRVLVGLPLILEYEELILANAGLGRLLQRQTQTITTVDEPFAFRSALNYIKQCCDTMFFILVELQWEHIPEPPHQGGHWNYALPTALMSVFNGAKLPRSLFVSINVQLSKTLDDNNAYIVGLDNLYYRMPSEIMRVEEFLWAHCLNGSKARRGGQAVAPFFYTSVASHDCDNRDGPDVVFVVRIGAYTYPVFVRSILFKQLDEVKAMEAYDAVHVSRLRAWVPNLLKYCSRGQFMSMIFTYPSAVGQHLVLSSNPPQPYSKVTGNFLVLDRDNAQEILSEEQIQLLEKASSITPHA
ncbi:hypothetical protein BGZ58_011107 [Dissophora ornata]|nr:hypothetical protein BGZ58_011107 [Dissophora ornata]